MPTHKTYSFRPPPEIETEIIEALAATNASVTDLLTRCVQRSLHQVVREMHDDRSRAASAFLKDHATPYRTKTK